MNIRKVILLIISCSVCAVSLQAQKKLGAMRIVDGSEFSSGEQSKNQPNRRSQSKTHALFEKLLNAALGIFAL